MVLRRSFFRNCVIWVTSPFVIFILYEFFTLYPTQIGRWPVSLDITESVTTVPISAYFEPGKSSVRIFLIADKDKKPNLTCRFVNSVDQSILSTEIDARDERGRRWSVHPLIEYAGQFRGFVAFCDVPSSIKTNIPLSVVIRSTDRRTDVILPIFPGRSSRSSDVGKRHVGICMTPWFNMKSYTTDFLVTYIELHRLLGVSVIAFYMADEPTSSISSLLASYLQKPTFNGKSEFRIIVVPWLLPIPDVQTNTWYRDQVLSNNDCLYRLGNEVDYVFFADFDEMLVPDVHLSESSNVLATWKDVIKIIERHPESKASFCFPSRFFPPSNTTSEGLIYDRVNATEDVYDERKKCLLRTSVVEETYVHWPVKPRQVVVDSKLGVIFHYRECLRKVYKPCSPNTRYSTNTGLQPYLTAGQSAVEARLKNI